MKFNAKVFWKVFLTLSALEMLLFATGCTSAWISAVSALLPSLAAVVNAILSFVMALEGKTVSSSTVAAIQKWQQNIAAELSNLETIIADIKQAATASLVAQFQAGMQAVLSTFSGILSGLDITDTATVSKLTQFVSLGVAAINAILALIPMALQKMQSGASEAELRSYDKVAGAATVNANKVMRETYHSIVTDYTDSTDVNSALATLPQNIQ